MKAADLLSDFVERALASGRDRSAIAGALRDAGWSQEEVDGALAQWGQADGLPPVPRPTAYVSAGEVLLYGLLFISLVKVSLYTVMLGHGIVDWLLPDPADLTPAGGDVLRWPIAALVAFLPLFLYLNRRANRGSGQLAVRQRSLMRRWIGTVMSLIAILVLISDLVMVVYFFLDGDLSLRFIAKVALVAVMAALVLAYCRDELDG